MQRCLCVITAAALIIIIATIVSLAAVAAVFPFNDFQAYVHPQLGRFKNVSFVTHEILRMLFIQLLSLVFSCWLQAASSSADSELNYIASLQ
jgi:hypothetical protein